jgi:broad specificity phosphatase PhoE
LRAETFLNQLKDQHGHTQDAVAIVSHGGFYNHLLSALLGLPITNPPAWWFTLYNTAITRFDFLDDHVRIAYQNRVDFLPPALIT